MPEQARMLLDLHFRAYEEDGQWVSECVELGTASCGKTMPEALSAIIDATNLYIEVLSDEGELADVLRERGVTVERADDALAGAELTARVPVTTGVS